MANAPRTSRNATSLQRSMMLASMKGGRPPAYHIQRVLELAPSVDTGLLREAWRHVVGSHEALRCSCEFDGASLQLRMEEAPPFPWRESGGDDLDAEFAKPFPPGGDAPLWRVLVSRMPDGSRLMSLTVHHVIADAHACAVMLEDLFAAYGRLARNEPRDAPPATPGLLCYLDWHAGQTWSEAESFWRKRLGGGRWPSEPVAVHGSMEATEQADAAGRVEVDVPAELDAALRSLAERLDVTMNTLVLAAWALWSSRSCDEPHAMFGAIRACRKGSVPGAERIVGSFVNTLPLCIDVPDGIPVGEWLREIRREWIDLRPVEHCPLDRIHAWSGLPLGAPLFASVVNFQRSSAAQLAAELDLGGHARLLRVKRTADTPIALAASERPSLAMEIVFKPGQVGEGYARAAACCLPAILEQFVRKTDRPLGELSLVSDADRAGILARSRGPAMPVPADENAWTLFEKAARTNPEGHALVSGERAWTWREALDRASAVARRFGKLGIGRGDVVGIAMPAAPEVAMLMLGIAKAGAAFLILDVQAPAEARRRILHRARISCIAGDASAAPDGMRVVDPRTLLAAETEQDVPGACLCEPDGLAYLVHTSGSTGEPKFIQIEHGSLTNILLALAAIYGLTPGDRRLQRARPGTDFFIAEILVNLCAGAAIVFHESQHAVGVAEFVELVERHRITVTGMPSSYWHEWVRAMAASGNARLPRSLRLVITGMEKVEAESLRLWRSIVGDRVCWLNVYGPSETTMVSTWFRSEDALAESVGDVPIGQPVANTQVLVVDRAMRLRPAGMSGDICIAGAGLMRGYMLDDGSTSRPFVSNAFAEDPRFALLYGTGDCGHALVDGNIVFHGRRDNQVKIRGHRIELEAVESALSEALRGCAVAAAVGERDGQAALWAFVETREAFEEGEIKSLMRHRVHPAMVPGRIVQVDKLPLLANGKIDRRSLAAHCASFDADGESAGSFDARALDGAPEDRIAAIFRHVLARPDLAAGDDFFASGGDSLAAIRAIAEIEEALGWQPPLRDFYGAGSAAGLARRFAAGSARGDVFVSPVDGHADLSAPLHLLLVPPATGVYRKLQRLGTHWKGSTRLWMLEQEPPAPDPGLYPVEWLAANYARKVREGFDGRAVSLFGYSSGALVAWELASQLAESGFPVRELVLVEPTTVIASDGGNAVDRMGRKYSRRGLRETVSLYRNVTATLPPFERLAFVAKLLHRFVRVRVKDTRVHPTPEKGYMLRYQSAVCLCYRPRRYEGRVHLVRGHELVASEGIGRHDRHWAGLAPDIRFHEILGNHLQMFSKPEVQITAARIAAIVDGAGAA